MKKPEIPANEVARIAALCGLTVLDTPAEKRFDRITRIAQQHFQVPITLVSLVDSGRQWFKSRQGLAATETPRDISFCGHAILSEDILYVPNALDDPRFADNPLVTTAPNIRFYAGAPLHAPGGERVGTLCIIDDRPRTFTPQELTVLRDLAGCVEVELERTRIVDAAHEAQRFKQMLDKARDMIFMFDADSLLFVYLNQGAVQSMGYTREEMLQLHPYDINPSIPEPLFRPLIAPLLSGEQDVLQFETVHRRKDGFDFPVEIYLQLAREEDAGRFVAIVRDITERKRVEAALTANESRIRAIVDTVVDGIISIDSRGSIQTANPAAEKLFGYSCEEMLGRNVNFLMPEPFHSAHDSYLHNYLVTGHKKIIGIGREVIGRRKDGSTFQMELAVSEMEINGQRMFTGIVRDITERKQAEAQLRAVMAMRQAIFDSANFSIIATSTDGIIQVFNKGAQRMLGYSEEEVVGKETPAILHAGEEVVARAKILSEELGETVQPGFDVFVIKARRGQPDENEWTYVRKDGSTFQVLLSVTALFDAEGKIFGYLGIGADLTERKRIDQMKREFISTVSHELRTPLTSIRGALGLVAGGATGDLPEKAKELVTIATNNCDRLVRLINDILDMEKIESGKMMFNMQSLDLSVLIRETIAANQAYAAQHHAKIVVEGELAAAQIVGDRDRLIQVLTNLLSNAAKFSPPGGTVYVSLVETVCGVSLRVRDQGPGISEAFQAQIFQKFSQEDASDTRSKSGTGLGLSIAKVIVEQHGGQIGFETQPRQGSTFYVDLPLQPVALPSALAAGRTCVLVVEDDPDVAKLLRLLLEQEGYAVDNAYNIAQARIFLASARYAAITLDLLLPGEKGLSFIRELRQKPETENLPVIVVSAVAERGRNELNGSAISVLDWLEKPIDEVRLLNAVALAANRSAAHKILHVEDDPDIGLILKAMLEGVAEVDVATSLAEAQASLNQNSYVLVILDIGLPDGSGLDLLPRLSQTQPPTPVVIFSALELDEDIRNQVSAAFVKSRTDVGNLVQAIRSLMLLTTPRDQMETKDEI